MKDVLKYFEEISDPRSGIDRYGIPLELWRKNIFMIPAQVRCLNLGIMCMIY